MAHYELDVLHLLCPLPVLKTDRKVKELKPGDILEVIGDDPTMLQDLPIWCRTKGHILLDVKQIEKKIFISIQVESRKA